MEIQNDTRSPDYKPSLVGGVGVEGRTFFLGLIGSLSFCIVSITYLGYGCFHSFRQNSMIEKIARLDECIDSAV